MLCVVHSRESPVSRPRSTGSSRRSGPDTLDFCLWSSSRRKAAVSHLTVPAVAFGDFLCTLFDEWLERGYRARQRADIRGGPATAFGREHGLCIFRKTCGDIPVVEHNGDFFSCDHFVDAEHCLGNISEIPLVDLLEDPRRGNSDRPNRKGFPVSARHARSSTCAMAVARRIAFFTHRTARRD